MELRILETAADVQAAALRELESHVLREPKSIVCFATGGTYAAFYAALTRAVGQGTFSLHSAIATHLDEYIGHDTATAHGMAHEIVTTCPPLAGLLQAGRFWPVPASGRSGDLRAHEARLAEAGGVGLLYLGIGRNGHIAFNEPGTPFELGFHRTTLAETTREDARGRFAPLDPPREAVTAGPGTILAARKIVLCATGPAKAAALRATLEGPITPQCPASVLRRHPEVVFLVDRAAAAQLSSSLGTRARGVQHGH